MSNITIEQIESKQSELEKLIEKFKAQQPVTYYVPVARIELKEGERYAGLVLNDEGKPLHHLILLPGDRDDIKWNAAKEWAESIDGALPTRQEQALMYANLKGQFEQRAYWSGEAHASASDYAWSQNFSTGYQGCSYTYDELRARAVRRLAI